MPNTFLVNVIPDGTSETSATPLVTLNGTPIAGITEVRLTLFKRLHNPLNVGPVNPTTGLPNVTATGAYDGFASLELKIADPSQSAIMDSVSQLSKVPGNPAVGTSTSATRTPIRTQRAVPGDTIQLVNAGTNAPISGTSFLVPGEWNDVANATAAYGDSAVANP